MGFQFEGVCCEMTRADISVARFDDLIKGLADPMQIGNVSKADITPSITEKTVRNYQIRGSGVACSTKEIEKIEIALTINCSKTFNKELFLGAGRTNFAASTAGTPRSIYKYISKNGAQTGETRMLHLDVPFDAKATGTDLFKVEGYNMPATPLILNNTSNTTTPATPTLTALVQGLDYMPVLSQDSKSIVAIELFMSSTKFAAFTTFVAGAVNLKITGKTFETVQLTPYNQSKVDLFVIWTGLNIGESQNYAFSGAFYKVSCDVGGIAIISGEDFSTMEIKGTVLNDSNFRIMRPDLVGSNGANLSNLGYISNQTN